MGTVYKISGSGNDLNIIIGGTFNNNLNLEFKNLICYYKQNIIKIPRIIFEHFIGFPIYIKEIIKFDNISTHWELNIIVNAFKEKSTECLKNIVLPMFDNLGDPILIYEMPDTSIITNAIVFNHTLGPQGLIICACGIIYYNTTKGLIQHVNSNEHVVYLNKGACPLSHKTKICNICREEYFKTEVGIHTRSDRHLLALDLYKLDKYNE